LEHPGRGQWTGMNIADPPVKKYVRYRRIDGAKWLSA
jgi:hypothetical protein